MLSKEIWVSVIVPVYNAEAFLARCVDSILRQTYSNIELVLVDDGSTDLSADLCDAYEQENKNVIVIHQENAGDSAARNAGIRKMHGTFVFFVDADDYIPLDAIEKLIKVQIEKNADIVIGTVNTKETEKLECIEMTSPEMAMFCINQNSYMQKKSMPEFVRNVNPGSQCMKIIRKSLITDNSAWFNEQVRMHHQDTLFSMKLYSLTDNIVLTNIPTYFYSVDVPESMRKRRNLNKLNEADILVRNMADIIKLYKMDNSEDLLKQFYIEILYECWSEYFVHRANQDSLKKRKEDLLRYTTIFQSIIPFQYINVKQDIASYRYYQRLIIQMVLHQKYFLLTILSWVWSKCRK